jgi:hypothetical protein
MAKIHYFQRYSTVENTVTNNTLQLLARVYAYSTTQASKLLNELTGETIELGIEISQQKRGQASVPDGWIVQRSFKILIESKVDSATDTNQLLRHADSFSGEDQKVLLLLTRESLGKAEDDIKKQISARHPDVIFKNVTYEQICRVVKSLFREYEGDMRELADDYEEYCNDAGLFDQSQYLMRIVPCGESVNINRRHGIYFQPSDRGYTQHQYVGIYKNKTVNMVLKIDSVFDVEYDGVQLKKTLIQGRQTDEYDGKLVAIIEDAKKECGYNITDGHRFFCGTPKDTNYIKSSYGGIMGHRFVNLKEVLGDINDVSEIAQILTSKQWE